MHRFNQYWTLIRLSDRGEGHPQELPQAKALIQQLHPSIADNREIDAEITGDPSFQRQLQQQLLSQANGDFDSPAMLALRCYISHQILIICRDFAKKFGQSHLFSTSDLLGYVLDDSPSPSSFTPGSIRSKGQSQPAPHYRVRSAQILDKFDPAKASLSTWTKQIIQADRDLNDFFHQQGLRLISDWALLNTATPGKITRLLPGAANLAQTVALLNAYHAVYRQTRLMNGDRGRCKAPTAEQCQAISNALSAQSISRSAAQVLLDLQALADLIREDDIAIKRGTPPSESLDRPEQQAQLDTLASLEASEIEDETPWQQLSDRYQAEFSACLHWAAKDVITKRHQRLKPKKAEIYPRAMILFYCEGWKMAEIASHLGINDQSGISRLLDLKRFRADLRHQAIAQLQNRLSEIFSPHMSPAQLAKLDHRIDITLGPEIDRLIKAETDEAQTPRQYLTNRSTLAQAISQVLKNLYAPQPICSPAEPSKTSLINIPLETRPLEQ